MHLYYFHRYVHHLCVLNTNPFSGILIIYGICVHLSKHSLKVLKSWINSIKTCFIISHLHLLCWTFYHPKSFRLRWIMKKLFFNQFTNKKAYLIFFEKRVIICTCSSLVLSLCNFMRSHEIWMELTIVVTELLKWKLLFRQ